MTTDELAKLEETIKTLEEVDPESPKLAKKKAEREELLAAQGKVEPGDDAFELDMDEDELAEVATGFSSRPAPGDYVAQLGIPDKNYSDSSMRVPFTITEEGPWKGHEEAFFPGKSKAAAFSIKNICESAGVKSQVNPKTKKAFYPISQLAGKRIMVVYKMQLTPGTWVGNDGIERENTPQSKVAHAKPYYEKPKTIM